MGGLVERTVDHDHGDARLVLQVIGIGGVFLTRLDRSHRKDHLNARSHNSLGIEVLAAGQGAQIRQVDDIGGQVGELLFGEVHRSAGAQLGRQREAEDLACGARVIDLLELLGSGQRHRAARIIGHRLLGGNGLCGSLRLRLRSGLAFSRRAAEQGCRKRQTTGDREGRRALHRFFHSIPLPCGPDTPEPGLPARSRTR